MINNCPQMAFTPDGYKLIEICFFGKVSEYVKDFTFGDIVLLKNPKSISSTNGIC